MTCFPCNTKHQTLLVDSSDESKSKGSSKSMSSLGRKATKNPIVPNSWKIGIALTLLIACTLVTLACLVANGTIQVPVDYLKLTTNSLATVGGILGISQLIVLISLPIYAHFEGKERERKAGLREAAE